MAAVTSPTEEPEPRVDPRTRRAYRTGFAVAIAAVVLSVTLLPFAVLSLYQTFNQPVGGVVYDLTPPRVHGAETTTLNVAAVSIDEVTQVVQLRISGFHRCALRCEAVERVQLFSVHANAADALGAPPSVSVALPNHAGEVNQLVSLPITGNLIDYPFDHYRLLLGVAISTVASGGSTTTLSPPSARESLAFSITNDIPRVTLAQPRLVTYSHRGDNGVSYDEVIALTLSRPPYLKVLTVLLIMLITLASIYGVLLEPFQRILATIGGLVLGIWGVRSLLVGSYPPDSTGVDLVLEAVILLILLTVIGRATWHLYRSGRDSN